MSASVLQIIAMALCVASLRAATLQERIDAAARNEILYVEAGVHSGSIVLSKPLTLLGENGAEIHGNGNGNVITVSADDVTIHGLRITGSGLQLSDDNAAVFVTGNRVKIENCVIGDSLHCVYLK